MLKIVLVGVWVCIATLGGVFLASYLSKKQDTANAAPAPVVTSVVKGTPISIPVINNGAVDGYFLTRISLMVDSDKAKKTTIPMEVALSDQLFSLLMGDRMIDLQKVGNFNPATFRTKIKDGLNSHMGEGVVTDVMIEQLDYMSKDALKSNAEHRTDNPIPATKIVDGTPAPAGQAASH